MITVVTKLMTGLHQRSASFVAGLCELAGKVSNSLNREGGGHNCEIFFIALFHVSEYFKPENIFF